MTDASKKAPKRKPGRKSTFNEKDAAEIVARLSKGEPLAVICRDDWLPTDDTVRNWAAVDESFGRRIACAREVGFDAIAYRARMTARGLDDALGGDSTADVQRDKLIIDTDLKLLAKWDPKRYGDKLALTDPDGDRLKVEVIKRVVIDTNS